jgi:hypothetical protein
MHDQEEPTVAVLLVDESETAAADHVSADAPIWP